MTRKLAEDARDLVWDHNVALKDAIHVATALSANVAMLKTFDDGLIKKAGKIGTQPLTICRPFVRQPRFDLRTLKEDATHGSQEA